MNKTTNERGEIITNTTEIQTIKTKYYENLHARNREKWKKHNNLVTNYKN